MNQIIHIISSCLLALLLVSCEKEDIMRYDCNRSAIEFDGKSYAYSFKKTSRTVDTVSIPFNIVGYPEDRERRAEFVIIPDSTTASAEYYSIVDAIVKPNQYKGTLRVRVENKVGDQFGNVRIYFQIANGGDFIPGLDLNKNYFLYLSNNLVRPITWPANKTVEKLYLGTYSTAYYQFIIEVTGETEFPFLTAVPGYNNGKTWNTAEANAILDKITQELVDRNKRVGKKLEHDDGPAKGLEVVVGKYYQF